ncbi:MAG: V-type ATP synthase subunit E [Chloroflexota bacterium]
MQNISEAVVDKIRDEAKTIVDEAEEEARKEVEKAKAQRDARLEAEKRRILTDAREEAARIAAQSTMQDHQQTASAKAEVLDDIVNRARESLKKVTTRPDLLAYLVNDAVKGLGEEQGKLTLLVSSKDVAAAKDLVKNDKQLSSIVAEVQECDCDGGAIVRNESKTISVDNTYTTRLEMLLPRILPEISKELF